MKKILPLFILAMTGLFICGRAQSAKYLELDGNSQYMTLPETVNIPDNSDFTITCQVKLDNSSTLRRIISDRNGYGNSAFEMITGGGMQFGVNLNDASGSVGPPFSVGTIGGAWHHVAMVIDRNVGSCTIYIDGVQEQQKIDDRIKTGIFSNANEIIVGAWDNNGSISSFVKGAIDNIRMWSKAFTASELITDMSHNIDGTESDLIGAWDFENVSGNTVPDISGNGNAGTLHGSPVIDEVKPMEYDHMVLQQVVRPTGIGNENQKVMVANVKTKGTQGTVDLTSLVFNMNGTPYINDVSHVYLYYNGAGKDFSPATATQLADWSPKTGDFTFNGTQTLENGNNYFFITYDISSQAKEGNVIDAEVKSVTVGGKKESVNPSAVAGNRIILLGNTTLYKPGDAGSDSYRIPAIVTAKDGSLITAADKRNNGSGDLRKNGNIDIVIKRSTDNGKTWSSPLTIAGEGTDYCYGDAALMVDENTGDILCVFNGNTGFFQSSQSDWVHLFVSRSTDNGVTWSSPEDITDQIYGPNCANPISKDWIAVFVTSGRLTQLRSGRILGVMPVREPSGNTGLFTMYSDDGGHSWDVSTSNAVPSTNGGGNESKTVELDNGDVLMSIRTRYTRRYNISKDGGITWGTAYNSTMSDPGVDGDIIRYTSVKDGDAKSILVHSLAYSPGNATRKDVSLYVSFDEGETWPVRKTIDPEASAYSSVTVLDDGSLGIFYEDGENGNVYNLVFTRVSMDWLTEGYTPPQELKPVTPAHSLTLDGFENYMSVANDAALNITPGEDYTISLWAKGTGQTNTYPRIIAKRPGASGTGYELFTNGGSGKMAWNMGPSGGTQYSADVINDGNWHHLAMAVDNSSAAKGVKVYVDGKLTVQNTINDGSDFTTSADLFFGGANTSPIKWFYKGKIDDIHIWDKALSETEIEEDMINQVNSSSPDLLAAWDFESIADNIVPDISGNEHIGTLYGYTENHQNDTIQFSVIPQNLQFFARDENNEAKIEIAGKVKKNGFSSIEAEFFKDGKSYAIDSKNLTYKDGKADFSLEGTMQAELKEYKVVVTLKNSQNQDFVMATRDSLLCGDVFGIMGQSNSHPTRAGFTYKNEFLRSFGKQTNTANYDTYNPADTTWGLAQANYTGTPGTTDNTNPTFFAGPYMAGVWGVIMMDSLKERLQIPICVINGGTGSSTIEENLPQGNGHYDLTTIYGRMMYRLKKSGLQDAVKAMFWHQGEKNANNTWKDYPTNFETLYNAWKQDLPHLERVYVFQTNLNSCYGSASIHQADMREWQRALSQNYNDIVTIASAGVPGTYDGIDNRLKGCHYSTEGYKIMGEDAFYTLAQDLYDVDFEHNLLSPNIKEVYYADNAHKQINLIFNNNSLKISDPNHTGKLNEMKNYFYFGGDYGKVKEMRISKDTLKFIFSSTQNAETVTYLPPRDYNNGGLYLGPYLTNARGGGALTFQKFPIENKSILKSTDLQAKVVNEKDVELSWQVSKEVNIKKYKIERSADSMVFKKIAEITAKGGTGNIGYTYLDKDRSNGIFYYRFETIGIEGNIIDTSNIVRIEIDKDKDNQEDTGNNTGTEEPDNNTEEGSPHISSYPNPITAGSDFTLQAKKQRAGQVIIKLANSHGQVVRSLKKQVGDGDTDIRISTVGLSGGLYFIKMINLSTTTILKSKIIIE